MIDEEQKQSYESLEQYNNEKKGNVTLKEGVFKDILGYLKEYDIIDRDILADFIEENYKVHIKRESIEQYASRHLSYAYEKGWINQKRRGKYGRGKDYDKGLKEFIMDVTIEEEKNETKEKKSFKSLEQLDNKTRHDKPLKISIFKKILKHLGKYNLIATSDVADFIEEDYEINMKRNTIEDYGSAHLSYACDEEWVSNDRFIKGKYHKGNKYNVGMEKFGINIPDEQTKRSSSYKSLEVCGYNENGRPIRKSIIKEILKYLKNHKKINRRNIGDIIKEKYDFDIKDEALLYYTTIHLSYAYEKGWLNKSPKGRGEYGKAKDYKEALKEFEMDVILEEDTIKEKKEPKIYDKYKNYHVYESVLKHLLKQLYNEKNITYERTIKLISSCKPNLRSNSLQSYANIHHKYIVSKGWAKKKRIDSSVMLVKTDETVEGLKELNPDIVFDDDKEEKDYSWENYQVMENTMR